jgi:hypothetical protein
VDQGDRERVSERGAILDAFKTQLEAAISGIKAERRGGLLEDLPDTEFPHAFIYAPSDVIEELPHGESRETVAFRCDVGTIADTQEQIELKRDAIKQRIEADPTMGGVVDDTRYAGGALAEWPDRALKAVALQFESLIRRRKIVTLRIDCRVSLVPGATPASVLAAMAAKLAATTGGARLASDYLPDEAIASGAVRFQLRGVAQTVSEGSTVKYTVLPMVVVIHRRLAVGEVERAYTEGAMQTYAEVILDPAYWRVAGVFDVVDVPELSFPSDVRVGGVSG